MFAALAAKLAVPIIGAVLSSIAALITSYLRSQQDQQTGMVIEAAKVDQTTATTAVAMAQAEADAPKTLDGVIDRLNKGTF